MEPTILSRKMYQTDLHFLMEFGLKKNHIKILNALLSSLDKRFTARELSTLTSISVSRIYRYLDELYKFGLIDKTIGINIKFWLTDPETRFRKFLEYEEQHFKDSERKLFNIISQLPLSGNMVVPLLSFEDYYKAVYQLILKAKWIKAIPKTPILLFEEYRKDYWRNKIYELYKEIIKKRIEVHYLVETTFLKNKKFNKEDLEWLSKCKNVKLKITSLDVVSMIISDKEVIMSFRHKKEQKVMKGLLLRSETLVDFFETTFDEIFQRSKEV